MVCGGRCGASGIDRCDRSATDAGCPRKPCECGMPKGDGHSVRSPSAGIPSSPEQSGRGGRPERPAPDDFLGDTLALLHVRRLRPAVHIGSVEKVDPSRQSLVHDLEAGGSSVTMPKFIVPRARRLTCTPERPTNLYCILLLLFRNPLRNCLST